jgi:hypothetical protein
LPVNADKTKGGGGYELLQVLALAAAGVLIVMLLPGKPATAGWLPAKPPTIRLIVDARDTESSPWSPTLIALPSKPGFSSVLREEPPGDASFKPIRGDAARIFGRSESSVRKSPALADNVSFHASATIDLQYRPEPVEPPAYAPGRHIRPGVLSIEPTGNLIGRGFEAGLLSASGPVRTEDPWEARVFVEIDARGAVSYAFLATPSSREPVDAEVMRTMLMGRLKQAGEPCSGIVVVTWTGIGDGSRR